MFIEFLKDAFSSIPELIPQIPDNKRVLLNDDGDLTIDEDHDTNVVLSSINQSFFITYAGSKGETARRVNIKKIKKSANGHLVAYSYCYERKAIRGFRVDRITECVDMITGEVFEGKASLFLALGFDANGVVDGVVLNTRNVLNEISEVLDLFVYIARCDGDFYHAEQDVILNYICDEYFNNQLDGEYLLSVIKKRYPSFTDFLQAIEYLKKTDLNFQKKIIRYVAQLVQADGVVCNNEIKFIHEMNDFISQ